MNIHHELIADREQSVLAEAFRSLRMTLQVLTEHEEIKSVLFTSGSVNPDNDLIAANAAVMLAYSGKRVAFVDCNFYSAYLYRVFRLRNIGVADYLQNQKSAEEILQSTHIKNLTFIASGKSLLPSVSILATQKFYDFLADLSGKFDYVIVNSHAIIVSNKEVISDGCILAAKVDGTVLILESKAIRVVQARAVLEMLKRTRTKIIGTILSNAQKKELFLGIGRKRE